MKQLIQVSKDQTIRSINNEGILINDSFNVVEVLYDFFEIP